MQRNLFSASSFFPGRTLFFLVFRVRFHTKLSTNLASEKCVYFASEDVNRTGDGYSYLSCAHCERDERYIPLGNIHFQCAPTQIKTLSGLRGNKRMKCMRCANCWMIGSCEGLSCVSTKRRFYAWKCNFRRKLLMEF
jgi:hypothetical protein